MKYYRVILKEPPVLRFAHTYISSQYNIVFPKFENFIEISFVEQGGMNIWKDGQLVNICPEQALAINYGKEAIRCNSEASWHRHITVGLAMEYEIQSITEEQVITCSREQYLEQGSRKLFAILPAEPGMTWPKNHAIPSLLGEIARLYPDVSAESSLYLTSQVLKLLSEITKECVRQSFALKQISPANIKYAQKAMDYISENVHRRIAIEEIAEVVNISPTHLGNVFKMVTGQTLIEYINQIKMQVVKELVLGGHMSFAQAGERVGITDAAYLSRLFRKCMKTTIQQMKKEQVENRY